MPEVLWVTSWDRNVFVYIHSHFRNSALDNFLPYVSDFGLGHVQVFGILLSAVWLGAVAGEFMNGISFNLIAKSIKNRSDWVVPLLIAFAISGSISTMMKHAIDRDRPWGYYAQEHEAGRMQDVILKPPIRKPLYTHGFISGHTATSFGICTVLLLLSVKRPKYRKTAGFLTLFATGIGFSRIYIVDHWPLDVVGGAFVGALSGAIAVGLQILITRKKGNSSALEFGTILT